MSEATITRQIIAVLKQQKAAGRNVWWFKVHGGPMQRAGVPDLYVLVDGVSIWVEIKTPAGRVSPLQERTIEQIGRAGGRTAVVRSVEEFCRVVNTSC